MIAYMFKERTNKTPYYLFLLFFICCFSLCGQNKYKSDSILLVLKQKKTSKKEKILLLNTLAYYHPKNDTCLFILKEALQLSKEIQVPILEAKVWEELVYAEKRLGNNANSLNAAFKALAIYESLSLKEEQAATYAQIAEYYTSEKEYTTAIIYLEKAKMIYSNSNDVLKEVLTLLNLGELYRLSEKLIKAESIFLTVLTLNENLKEKDIEAYSLGNLGMLYNSQNNLSAAKKNLNKATSILQGLGDSYASSIYLLELGKVYEKEKNFKTAENKYKEAYQIAYKNDFKEQIRNYSKQLSLLYKQEKKFEHAYAYQEIFQIFQDSLINKENIQQIEQVKSKYQVAKKEVEINFLNTKNQNQKNLVIGLVIGLSLVLLMSYLLYKVNLKVKNSNQLLTAQKELISKKEQEKAILLKELNHRTKNNLQMISSLLNLQGNKLTNHPAKEAILSGKHRVEALSLVHRKLYQDGVDSHINIKEYIEELILGLFYSYNANFSPTLKIEAVDVHIDTAVPLALIINELIINALKYAYSDSLKPELQITIQQYKTDTLNIDVKDNGIGFELKEEENNQSFGLKLLNSLVQQLKGNLKMISDKGTHWKIEIDIS